MRLFIQILNGTPIEHPILEDNFREVFPDIDIDNLPAAFAEFQRIPVPCLSINEIYEGVTYEWDNGIVKDVHHVREMSEEEKILRDKTIL